MISGMGEQARANRVAWVSPSVHACEDGGGKEASQPYSVREKANSRATVQKGCRIASGSTTILHRHLAATASACGVPGRHSPNNQSIPRPPPHCTEDGASRWSRRADRPFTPSGASSKLQQPQGTFQIIRDGCADSGDCQLFRPSPHTHTRAKPPRQPVADGHRLKTAGKCCHHPSTPLPSGLHLRREKHHRVSQSNNPYTPTRHAVAATTTAKSRPTSPHRPLLIGLSIAKRKTALLLLCHLA